MLYETWWLCDPILSIQDPASLSILVALESYSPSSQEYS